MSAKAYYPLFADVQGRRCVVIGGGAVAQRKAITLLSFGAQVTVVSPTLTRRLAAYGRRGKIRHVRRAFRPSDLRGAWLIYAATDDERINALVFRSAQRRRVFANVVDQPARCSFIAPAIFRRGGLTVAVSTAGGSPSLAKKLRSEIGQRVGREYAPMLHLLSSLRGLAKQHLPTYRDRKRYFDQLVQGEVFTLVRRGRLREARRAALVLLAADASTNGAARR